MFPPDIQPRHRSRPDFLFPFGFIRFPNNKPRYEKDYTSYAVFRDPNKCILCGDCVRVCEELQGQGILNFAFRGSELQVMPAFDKKLGETKCVGCGQCAAVCTTGAITVNDQIGGHPRPEEACGGADRAGRPCGGG